MGTIIKNISVSENNALIEKSYVNEVAKTALRCILDSGFEGGKFDILINAGIYREDHIAEPAVAALVQGKIFSGLSCKTEKKENYDSNKTFSFDLSNGANGLLNALKIIDSLISGGKVQSGIIIAGDSEPRKGLSENYYYKAGAAALSIKGSRKQVGFRKFSEYLYPDYISNYQSNTYWGKKPGQKKYNNILKVSTEPGYTENCARCAIDSLNNFMRENHLREKDIDLLICSQSPPGFNELIEKALPWTAEIIAGNHEDPPRHTSGLLYNLNSTWDNFNSENIKRSIFLSAGAGISVSIALYENYKLNTDD